MFAAADLTFKGKIQPENPDTCFKTFHIFSCFIEHAVQTSTASLASFNIVEELLK